MKKKPTKKAKAGPKKNQIRAVKRRKPKKPSFPAKVIQEESLNGDE